MLIQTVKSGEFSFEVPRYRPHRREKHNIQALVCQSPGASEGNFFCSSFIKSVVGQDHDITNP